MTNGSELGHPIVREDSTLTLRCSVCAAKGTATLISVDAEGFASWRWLQVPAGWWTLLGANPDAPPLVRCPDCLGAGD